MDHYTDSTEHLRMEFETGNIDRAIDEALSFIKTCGHEGANLDRIIRFFNGKPDFKELISDENMRDRVVDKLNMRISSESGNYELDGETYRCVEAGM
ncbi:MAG: hypothetical protein Q8P20_03135 [bacterium]|nr:hypothetical protein [bacterium]